MKCPNCGEELPMGVHICYPKLQQPLGNYVISDAAESRRITKMMHEGDQGYEAIFLFFIFLLVLMFSLILWVMTN